MKRARDIRKICGATHIRLDKLPSDVIDYIRGFTTNFMDVRIV